MNDQEYREHINKLIREMNSEVVLNGSPGHATIIIERMFANAKQSMCILSRTFDSRVFGTIELVEQAIQFLSDRRRKATILIEDVEPGLLEQHRLFRCNRDALERGNLEVRRVPESLAKALNINFAIMDDNGYRFEEDKSEPVASAAFGPTALVKDLRELFDAVRQLSKRIPVPEAVS